MKVRALAPHTAAVREALERRGMSPARADAAARGLASAAVVIDELDSDSREGIARIARAQGVACLTGDGWALLASDVARLAGLDRPEQGTLPPPLVGALAPAVRGWLEPPTTWETARGVLSLDRPRIAGILNVTPDSFSDGGAHLMPDEALRHAERLLEAGADLLDVGAESTRPGRPGPVPADEEWRRLEAVLPELARRHPTTPLSVDTVKAATARRALEAGAWIVNDVSGLRHDASLAEVCAEHGAGLVLMHSRGTLSELATYDHATYRDLMAEVCDELSAAQHEAEARGVPRERIVLDPGFGFAKRPEHNYAVLDRLAALVALGRPVMVGPSRKRFLGAVTGTPPAERDLATAAACAAAYERGAQLFRVHAVRETRETLAIAHAARTAA